MKLVTSQISIDFEPSSNSSEGLYNKFLSPAQTLTGLEECNSQTIKLPSGNDQSLNMGGVAAAKGLLLMADVAVTIKINGGAEEISYDPDAKLPLIIPAGSVPITAITVSTTVDTVIQYMVFQ